MLSECICRMVNMTAQERNEMGTNALKLVADKFRFDQMADKIEEILCGNVLS